MTQPCYKCPDRCQNCHASCGKYAAFRAELDKRREYNKQFQPIDPMPYSHEMEKKNRRRKYKRGQPMNKPTNEYIMAIKPEWVALIESKEKTLEIRRTTPYISPPAFPGKSSKNTRETAHACTPGKSPTTKSWPSRCLCPLWAASSRRNRGASAKRRKEHEKPLFLRNDPPGTRHE